MDGLRDINGAGGILDSPFHSLRGLGIPDAAVPILFSLTPLLPALPVVYFEVR